MTNEERIERKNKTIIIRRNHIALKESKVKVNINKAIDEDTFNNMLSMCKSQASVIQLCVENNKLLSYTEDLLVKLDLCKTIEDAHKRVKRHINNDKSSRIVKRALHMTSMRTQVIALTQ
jgi:hypothetical protein